MAGGKDSKLEGSDGDLSNLTLKNLTEEVVYLAEKLAKSAQEQANIKASLQVTDKRIERLVSMIKDKHLHGGFTRNPPPTNDDYDDTNLKWYVPEFSGAGDSEDFLEWVSHMEYFFDYKDFDDQMSYKIANIKLTKYASIWFAYLKTKLMREGAPRITTWIEMKRQLNNHFGLKECTEDKVVKKNEVKPDIVNIEDKHVESQ
ncbi:hypothetical protein POM88_025867 [Heracleum sosnowskyi]|uniref:Retrotransposon gag domain-containing protein n=1 Tax=Heracleum sosnowskyi TaxID=360622 RepID=A0AAD8I746_9APIA|nr:hypothetical protein POM88_025867 [Heracleum sosnowskyi]